MPEDYLVNPGDCISSIAYEQGFFWETVWKYSANAELKQKRKDPNVLLEGDVVHIPDKTQKEVSGATEQRHQFKLKGVPAKLNLKLMRPKLAHNGAESSSPAASPTGGGEDEDTSDLADADYVPQKEGQEPIKNASYVLEVDGVRVDEGKTDGNGCVKIPIQPNAREGRLKVFPSQPEEMIITLDLGGMDPIDEVSGIRKRLANLGFFCDLEGAADADDFVAALHNFQEQNFLVATGEINEATKAKLREMHGC